MSSESVPDREPAAVRGQVPSRHPGWRELGFSLKRLFKNPLTSIGLAIILLIHRRRKTIRSADLGELKG